MRTQITKLPNLDQGVRIPLKKTEYYFFFQSKSPLEKQIWYFVTKIGLTYCEKKCSSDREKLLKFEAEGREFAKFKQ